MKKKIYFFKNKKEAFKKAEKLGDNYIVMGLGGTPENPLAYSVLDKNYCKENMVKEGFYLKEEGNYIKWLKK